MLLYLVPINYNIPYEYMIYYIHSDNYKLIIKILPYSYYISNVITQKLLNFLYKCCMSLQTPPISFENIHVPISKRPFKILILKQL